jgi:hypothetical protein
MYVFFFFVLYIKQRSKKFDLCSLHIFLIKGNDCSYRKRMVTQVLKDKTDATFGFVKDKMTIKRVIRDLEKKVNKGSGE